LKQYKELSPYLSNFFILVLFLILSKAMSESTLKKLKREAREREVEAIRKEQMERERT
jgi:hypothetical protein